MQTAIIRSRFSPETVMKLQLNQVVTTPTTLVDFIATHTDLSKSSIKKALNLAAAGCSCAAKVAPNAVAARVKLWQWETG